MRDTEAAADPPAWTSVRARSFTWTVFVGALVGSCCGLAVAPPMGARFEARLPWTGAAPTRRDWPHTPRAGESASLESHGAGNDLLVTAGSAGAARSLARAFAADGAPDATTLAARLASVRREWHEALPQNPLPARTREAELAARLLARARWGRELADALPNAVPTHEVPEPTPPVDLVEAWQEVRRVALGIDPAAMATAIDRAGALEARWFTDAGAWPGWRPSARAEAWRRWQRVRAEGLQELAVDALAMQTPFQRQMADALADQYLLALDAGSGDPWQPFASSPSRSVRPLVRPILAVWWPPLASGAGAGMLCALLMLMFEAARRPALQRVRLLRGHAWGPNPAAAGPRLHVVAGGTPNAVLRAVLELAAQRVARGDRVLLVDGSARLLLHERLGRDARWGLLECLAADMPVLGLVQYAGHPGLYLLPHGNAERAVGWSSLGRKLDEVVPHFGRIVLALNPHSPAEIGDALRGRAMEGWWAGTDRRAAAGSDLATARFGIVFHGLDISDLSEPTLEVLVERVADLRPSGPAPETAPITAHAVPRAPGARGAPLAPIVLDCDLQVRQRLRALAWARRAQAENRRPGLQATT